MAKHREFDKDSMARISRVVSRMETEIVGLRNQAQYRRPAQANAAQETVLIGKTTAAITGTSTGGILGTGTVSVYTIAPSTAPTLADAGYDVTAYNLSTSSVSTGKWVMMKRHYQSGIWMIDFEDCG